MSETQKNKESSVFIAVRQGFGLVQRQREIHKVYPNGTTQLLCSGEPPEIWNKAFQILKGMYGLAKGEFCLKPDYVAEGVLPSNLG